MTSRFAAGVMFGLRKIRILSPTAILGWALHDHHGLAQLFQEGAMLVVGGGLPEARGHQQITKAATQLWDLDAATSPNHDGSSRSATPP